jgi:alpha-tubulin suppressor-like RCC1 family protein
VVTKQGECYAFGRGEYGRLGLGDTRSRYRPHLVEALKDKRVVQAACGGSHTLFLTADGLAYSAGRTEYVHPGCIPMHSKTY